MLPEREPGMGGRNVRQYLGLGFPCFGRWKLILTCGILACQQLLSELGRFGPGLWYSGVRRQQMDGVCQAEEGAVSRPREKCVLCCWNSWARFPQAASARCCSQGQGAGFAEPRPRCSAYLRDSFMEVDADTLSYCLCTSNC